MSISLFLNPSLLDDHISVPAWIQHQTQEVKALLETNETSPGNAVMQGSDISFHRAEELEIWLGDNLSSMNTEAMGHFDSIAADLLDTWFADVENEKSQIAVTNLLFVVHRIPKGKDPLPKTKVKLQECPATLLVKIFDSAMATTVEQGSVECLCQWAMDLLLESKDIPVTKREELAVFARKNPTLTSDALLGKFKKSLEATHAPAP